MKVKTIFLVVTLLQVLPVEKLVLMMANPESEVVSSRTPQGCYGQLYSDEASLRDEKKQNKSSREATLAVEDDLADWDFSMDSLKKLNPFSKDTPVATQNTPKDDPNQSNDLEQINQPPQDMPSPDSKQSRDLEQNPDNPPPQPDPWGTIDNTPEATIQEVYQSGSTATNATPPKKETPPPKPAWFALQKVWGGITGASKDDPGIYSNYGTLGLLFSPDYRPGTVLPQLDLRGHHLLDGKNAANAGLVLRYIPRKNSSTCWIWGANVFYDFRQGELGDYNQIGAGLEALGKKWEFRANGYFPIGNKEHTIDCDFTYPGGFEIMKHRCEYAFWGYDGEVGYYAFERKNYFIYAAAGVYSWGKEYSESNVGAEVRLRPQFKDFVALDLKVSYDPIFETVFQAELIVSLPLYRFSKVKQGRACSSDRQIYQRVERNQVMPYGRCCCFGSNF